MDKNNLMTQNTLPLMVKQTNNNYHEHLRNRFLLFYNSVQIEIVKVIPSSKHVYIIKVLKADLIDNEYNDKYL